VWRSVHSAGWRTPAAMVWTLPLLLMQKGGPDGLHGLDYPRMQRPGCRVAAALAQVAARARQVIVDLEGLEFMDSSGLAALVRARKHARLAGGDLLLAAPQRQVLRVLAITRLTDDFSVHACVEDAVGSPGRCATGAPPASASPVFVAVT